MFSLAGEALLASARLAHSIQPPYKKFACKAAQLAYTSRILYNLYALI
mgnify:CR=1 FL=1